VVDASEKNSSRQTLLQLYQAKQNVKAKSKGEGGSLYFYVLS